MDNDVFLFSVDKQLLFYSKHASYDLYHFSSHGPTFFAHGLDIGDNPMNRENGGHCYTHISNVNDHLKDTNGTHVLTGS